MRVSISNTSLLRSVTFFMSGSEVLHRCGRGTYAAGGAGPIVGTASGAGARAGRRPVTRGAREVTVMDHVNEITLIGRLSGEPEWRTLPSGGSIAVWRL